MKEPVPRRGAAQRSQNWLSRKSTRVARVINIRRCLTQPQSFLFLHVEMLGEPERDFVGLPSPVLAESNQLPHSAAAQQVGARNGPISVGLSCSRRFFIVQAQSAAA